jgi:uncharacterized membrane protein YciS (DUF1049 family)
MTTAQSAFAIAAVLAAAAAAGLALGWVFRVDRRVPRAASVRRLPARSQFADQIAELERLEAERLEREARAAGDSHIIRGVE